MIARKLTFAALTGGLTLAMLAQATPSFAIFPWYDARTGTWQRAGRAAVVVAPVAVAAPVMAPAACAPACNPCATAACSPCATTACAPATCSPCATACASPVISYVAETAYRVQVVNTPVTTYQPVLTPGPCGTCTTTFMPVTTLVAQTQQVPFTTYRPVVGCAAAPCATCPTTCCPTDACATGACATGQCASGHCGGVAQASATEQEAAPSLPAVPVPAGPTLQPEVRPEPAPEANSAPSYHKDPMTSTQRPTDTIPSSAPARIGTQPAPLQDLKQDGLKPVAPQLLDPNDKTAMRIDMPQRVHARMVNDSGWHAPR